MSWIFLIALVEFVCSTTYISLKKFSFYSKPVKYFFILTSFFWIGSGFLLFPGLYSEDFFKVAELTQVFRSCEWHSNAFSALVMSMGVLDKSYFLVNLFSVFLVISLYYRLMSLSPKLTTLNALFITIIFNLPSLYLFTFFTYRDVFVSLIMAHSIISLWKLKELDKENNLIPKGKEILIFEIFFTCFTVTLLKIDGIFYFLMMPVIFFLLRNAFIQKWLIIYFIFFAILLGIILKQTEGVNRWSYHLTAMSTSLNNILYKNDNLTEAQKQSLSKVVDIDYLYQNYDCCKPAVFLNAIKGLNISEQEWRQFKWTYFELVVQNWRFFLQHRIGLFIDANNFNGHSYIFQDLVKESQKFFNGNTDIKINTISFMTEYRNRFIIFLDTYFNKLGVAQLLFKSTFTFIVLSILGLIINYRKFFIWYVFLLILARNIPVFLTSPEAHLKYYGGFLFPMIVMIFLCFCTDDRYDPQIVKGSNAP